MKKKLKHILSLIQHIRANKKIKELKENDLVYVMYFYEEYNCTVYKNIEVCQLAACKNLFNEDTFAVYAENTKDGNFTLYKCKCQVRLMKEYANKNYMIMQDNGLFSSTILITTSLKTIRKFINQTYNKEINNIKKQHNKAYKQFYTYELLRTMQPLIRIKNQKRKIISLLRKLPTII